MVQILTIYFCTLSIQTKTKEAKMTIKMLVESLRAIPADQLRDAGSKLAQERVVYPNDWEDSKTELRQVSWRETRGYNLHLSASPKKALLETTPLLVSLLERTRGMQFAPGEFEVNADVCWPTDAFVQEHDLGSLSEVRVRSSFYARDPTKGRIGFSGRLHELEVELKDKTMNISAKGDYSALLSRIISELKPQFATIRLSKSDAQRLLNKARGLRRWALKRALQPKKRNYLEFQMGGGISFNEKEEIETTIATSALSVFSEAIGKPLINEVTGEQTFVVSLTKVFLRQGQILPTLQNVVRIINELRTRIVFDHPLITTSQAREMLEKEIDFVDKLYEHLLFSGMKMHMIRGSLVKRLAQEHFGDDILAPFDEMDESQYLAFLQDRGFKYDGEAEKKYEPPHSPKEIYLLHFFRQSYAKDPRESVERFRQYYVNSAPVVKITGKTGADAARVANLSLPTQALLSGFSLKECSCQGDNEVSITRSGEDKVHFWVRISLDSCKLLDLQEEVCKRMSIVC
jgi:hypothetical protein